MNGLKARLISLKDRVKGHFRRKCKNARRGSSRKQEVKLVSSATQTEEIDVPSEAVTPLPTSSSESVTPVTFPSTDLPPLSRCPRPPVMYMLGSPSLYSWDSCSTTVFSQSNEELNSWDSCSSIASILSEEKELNSWDSCSSIASILSEEKELNSWDSCSTILSTLSKDEHSISLRTGDDEDDTEGVECKDKEECAAIPSAGGNSVCSNDKLFPNTSSGIVADYSASEGDNNVDDGSDFDSDSDFDGNSSTSGSISDGEIQIIACGYAMEQSADEELEIQRVYRPVTQSSSSFGSKPEQTLLTLPPKMTQAPPILTDLLLVPPLRQRQSESGKILLPTIPPQILTDLLPVPPLRQRQSESGKIVLPTIPPQILSDLLPVPPLRQRQSESGKNVLPTIPPLRSTSSYHNNSLRSRKSGSSHLRSTYSTPGRILCTPHAWLV